jgi:hypothetical protein
MRMKYAVLLSVLSLALSTEARPPGKGQPDPNILVFDPATCGITIDKKRLSEAERRLLRIQIPEVDFRQANLFDMLAFLDYCIPKHGAGLDLNEKTRVRIVWDSRLRNAGGPNDPFDLDDFTEYPYAPYLPPPYKRIPILYSLKMIVTGCQVQYTVSNLTITVEQKAEPANKPPAHVPLKAAPSASSRER